MSRTLLRASSLVAGMTLSSRILGFARDLVIASVFGANGSTDAFFVAFKIPNFLRRLFAEGAFSQAFVPVLASARKQSGQPGVRIVMDRVSGSLGVLLILTALTGMWFSQDIILLVAPGFRTNPELAALGSQLLKITFPYLPLIAMTALAGAVLNLYGHFLIPAATPGLLNLAIILAALCLTDNVDPPIKALAFGVLAGGLLQLALQIMSLWKMGLTPRPRFTPGHPEVVRVFSLMSPALLGASVAQLNLLINTFLASLLETGSISWLYYSDRLLEFPLGLLGVALGTVILPHLSSQKANGNLEGFDRTLEWGIKLVLLMGLPATLGLTCLSEPLMYTLFQHDHFTPEDARMAARSLLAYGIGLPGFLLVKVLVPAFSAGQDLKTPARVGMLSVLINLAISLALSLWLAPDGWGHAGLALAASVAALFNAGALLLILKSRGHAPRFSATSGFWLRLSAANLTLGAGLFIASDSISFETLAQTPRILMLLGLILGGGLIYLGSLFLLGLRVSDFSREEFGR